MAGDLPGSRTIASMTERVLAAAHASRAVQGAPEAEPLADVLALVEEGHGVPVGVLALDAGVAGAYLRRPRGALILLNGTDAAARLRFTLAHDSATTCSSTSRASTPMPT